MARVKEIIEKTLQWHLRQLAMIRKTDVMAIYGSMHDYLPRLVRDEIERIKEIKPQNNTLAILLDTGGGWIDSVEHTVEIIRQHYGQVDFIIPRRAMSAGTIFALSANKIYMDYYSQLGPIDPQFLVDGKWVPVLGYLEKFKELNKKSKQGEITPLEYGLADKLDLADIHQYEQAREHSIELLEEWLPKYKFRNWKKTRTKKETVTLEMKQKRAKEIAQKLNDTKRWHAHSRRISMKVLQEELGLRIEDIRTSRHASLQENIMKFHTLILDFMETTDIDFCFRIIRHDKSEDNHEQI